MSAKFLKVMALSKRPSDFKHEGEPRPQPGPGASEGTAPQDLRGGTIRDTAPGEGTEPSGEAAPSDVPLVSEASEALQGTVASESGSPNTIRALSEDTGAFQGPVPSKGTESSIAAAALESSRPARETESRTTEASGPLKESDTIRASVPLVAVSGAGALRIYRCLRAQDGHSFAEDRLYGALWNSDLARAEGPDSKLITVGWDRMSQMAGMTPRNARENCFRLLEKLAFERVQRHVSEERLGTTYRIYSVEAVLRRRQAAGMEWVVRNRGGVTFVAAPPQGTVSSKVTVSVGSKGTVLLQESVAGSAATVSGGPRDVARACRQAAPAILETWVREAREITARPGSTEQDRAWAGEILAAYGAGEGKR